MSISSASIDSTGYYLSLTGTWAKSAGSGAAGTASTYPFGDYSLTPDTGPKVKLNVARPGYIRSGGQASAATRAKVIPGALMMRGPVQYDPPSSVITLPTYNAAFIPNNIPLDEVDNGTTRTVRILLSQRVYAGEGVTLDQYLWGFVDGAPIVNHWPSGARPATSALSDRLSKDLAKRGFKFVGSTIVYAYMQAIGMVDDHDLACFRRTAC